MSQEARRAILESGDEVIGSFPVEWNGGNRSLRGRLSADPGILVTLFDGVYSLTAEELGTVAVRFIDENGAFVLSSAQMPEVALAAAAGR